MANGGEGGAWQLQCGQESFVCGVESANRDGLDSNSTHGRYRQ